MSAHREKAELLLQLRRPADAEKAIREALAASPDAPDLYTLLSIALRRQGRTAEAVDAAQQAVGLAPDAGYTHATLGTALFEDGAKALAVKSMWESVRIDPKRSGFWAALSHALSTLGRNEDARAAAEAGLRADPSNVGCMNCRAVAVAALGSAREAVTQLERSLAIEPTNPWTHVLLGWFHMVRYRPWAAIRHYREALRLDPTDQSAVLGLRDQVQRTAAFGFVAAATVVGFGLFYLMYWSASWLPLPVWRSVGMFLIGMCVWAAVLAALSRAGQATILRLFPLGRALLTPADVRDSNHLIVVLIAPFAIAGVGMSGLVGPEMCGVLGCYTPIVLPLAWRLFVNLLRRAR